MNLVERLLTELLSWTFVISAGVAVLAGFLAIAKSSSDRTLAERWGRAASRAYALFWIAVITKHVLNHVTSEPPDWPLTLGAVVATTLAVLAGKSYTDEAEDDSPEDFYEEEEPFDDY